MAVARCNVSSRDFFIFILCVAFLSVLLNFQISYYGPKALVDQQMEADEIPSLQKVREYTDRYDSKILGRSLNQHDVESLKTRTTEGTDLHTKLAQIENRLLTIKHQVVALKTDETLPGDILIDRLHELDIEVRRNHDHLSWVGNDTVVQGNWTVLLCFDVSSCQRVHTSISQKVNIIPELFDLIKKPDVLCTASRILEQNNEGTLTRSCELLDCEGPMNVTTILLTGNKTFYNVSTTKEICKRKPPLHDVYVWYLPDKPMTFPGGPVLRIHCLIVSASPLRLYVHPEMLTGSFLAFQHPVLFQKIHIEDLLQYISEVYGLGTSSRWWREVQRKLLLFFVHLESKLQKSEWEGSKTCVRCFQSVSVNLVCSSVQYCRIYTVTTELKPSLSVIRSTLSLVTSKIQVSEEVGHALQQTGDVHAIEICKTRSDLSKCLTDSYLMYLLDWRREMRSSSEWIPIYPTKFGCNELSKVNRIEPESSATVKTNDVLNNLGDVFRWTDQTSTESQFTTDGDEVDYTDLRFTKQGRYVQGTTRLCSNDSESFGKLDEIYIYPQVELEEISPGKYNATVGYDVILVRLMAVPKSCKCQVKLENKYNDPGARNITLGSGWNKIMLYIVDTTSPDLNIVNTVTINIYRQRRGLGRDEFWKGTMHTCGLKQDCSLIYDSTAECGVFDLQTKIKRENISIQNGRRCISGDNAGQWVVPCRSCSNDKTCVWEKATWRANDCFYEHFYPPSLRQCLRGKKLLFIGDSTNRGVSNYIIEQINGSLYDWDKTHTTKVYTNINEDKTHFTFAYYPHFWLPADHRPKFSKVIYQLIRSSLPLQNDSNTVLVVGGVHWLAKQHIDLIIEALQRKGLSGITKIVKGLGAGFHQPVENVKFVSNYEHTQLQQREKDILDYAKDNGFHAVATYNMTISRYKDFLEGNCACHFHKVSRHGSAHEGYRYKVEGDINEAYSQILLNQICATA